MAATFTVSTFGRNHYVVDTRTGEFSPGVAFTSKAKAQARADEKNADQAGLITRCVDPSLPPGVIRIDGHPLPLTGFMVVD